MAFVILCLGLQRTLDELIIDIIFIKREYINTKPILSKQITLGKSFIFDVKSLH